MAKLIKRYNNDFFITSNAIFRDKRLSFQELGLLLQLLSLPDDWNFSVRGIAVLHKDSKDTVARALNKLIDYGYLYRNQKDQNRTKKGFFERLDYYIYDNPLDNPHYVPNENDINSLSQNPDTDNPDTDNETIYNTNEYNNKEYIGVDINIKDLRKKVVKQVETILVNSKEFHRYLSAGISDAFVDIMNRLTFLIEQQNQTKLEKLLKLNEKDIIELFYDTQRAKDNVDGSINNPDGYIISRLNKMIEKV